MRRRINFKIAIPAFAAGLLLVFAVVGALGANDSGTVARQLGINSSTDTDSATLPGAATDFTEESKVADASGAGAATSSEAAPTPTQGQQLVRTGDLALLLERDRLLATLDEITELTQRMSGYIVSSSVGSDSSTTYSSTDTPTLGESAADRQVETTDGVVPNQAWVTIRVPESEFEDAVKRLSKLGEVQSVATSATDVTSQVVDLEAQLRHARAVERRLLRFLGETETIREMLTVQDRLDAAQLTIEQLEAQLKSMKETTTYGTLRIVLNEKGTPQAGQIDSSDTFAGVFWNSLTLLGRGARLTALAATAALPFVVSFGAMGLIAWFVVRRLRARRRQQARPPAVA